MFFCGRCLEDADEATEVRGVRGVDDLEVEARVGARKLVGPAAVPEDARAEGGGGDDAGLPPVVAAREVLVVSDVQARTADASSSSLFQPSKFASPSRCLRSKRERSICSPVTASNRRASNPSPWPRTTFQPLCKSVVVMPSRCLSVAHVLVVAPASTAASASRPMT